MTKRAATVPDEQHNRHWQMRDAAQVPDLEGHGSGAASRGVRDGHSRLGPEGLPVPQAICVILALRLLPLPHQLQACSTVYSVSLSCIQMTLHHASPAHHWT